MKNENRLDEFEIAFVKLKDGVYDYSYQLDSTFFQEFDYQTVGSCDIRATLKMEKKGHLYQLHLSIDGSLAVACDRCLEPLPFPVQGERNVLVKQQVLGARMTPGLIEEDDDLLLIGHNEIAFNVASLFYDLCILSLPLVKNCDELPVKPCNNEMLEKLDALSGGSGEETERDPRWEKLKELLKEKK